MPETLKYERVKQLILEQIQSGRYVCGSRLPSEHELCRTFGASRITVRRALDDLAWQGVVEKRRGIGSFISDTAATRQCARSPKVAVVFPTLPDMLGAGNFSDMMRGIDCVLEEAGYSLVGVSAFGNSTDRLMRTIAEIGPAGILYPFFSGTEADLSVLESLNVPIVFIGSVPCSDRFDYVGGDNYNSAYRATKLMLDKGLKRIGFYSPVDTGYALVAQRLQGVKSALEDHGLPILDRLYYTGCDEISGNAAEPGKVDYLGQIREYLTKNPDIDGVIANNDTVAFYFFLVCMQHGIRVPEDLKIISYGNYYAENKFTGGLSAYETYSLDCGRQAATLLLQRIRHELPPVPQKREIYFSLIRRASF